MINTDIGRFWDLPWSLVDGCTPCSPGCEHCWSASMTHRFPGQRVKAADVIKANRPIYLTDSRGRFTGEIITHPERLSIPLRRRKPTVYAIWNDLFHEAVPDVFRERAYCVMGDVKQHTFLVLTKRPLIMAEYVNEFQTDYPHDGQNVYHGLTVCNQAEADENIPVFLQVPGKKFICHEPALGMINYGYDLKNIAVLIAGGETGPGARPSHLDIFRADRIQCAAAGVPFFFKGMTKGEHNREHMEKRRNPETGRLFKAGRLLDGRTHDELPWRKP